MSSPRHSRRSIFGLVLAGVTLALSAHAAFAPAGPGNVSFRAIGPAGLTIDGKGQNVAASESGGTIKVVAKLTDLKTGIDLRDDHLKKALEVNKYPDAILTIERSKLNLPADGKTLESSGIGQLTLHGVTKPTKFFYKATRAGADYEVKGRLEIDISQFKIEPPSYLGVTVEKDVKVKTNFKVHES